LLLVLLEFLEVFVGGTATASNVTTGAIEPVLGVLGYFGVRRLATASIIALFFGFAATRCLIPGSE
jgi:hypothetical protein